MQRPHLQRYLLLALAPLLNGCFFFMPDGSLLSFYLERPVDEQVVEGNLLGGLLGALVPVPINLEIDLAEETRARDTGPAQHVYLTDFELGITDTAVTALDGDDFGFLDSVEIYVESRQSGSRLPRQRIAYLQSVPDGATHLALVVEDVDLIEYVNEGALLTASATGQQPIDDVSFDGMLTLVVEVL
jgi:hypothetical protein